MMALLANVTLLLPLAKPDSGQELPSVKRKYGHST